MFLFWSKKKTGFYKVFAAFWLSTFNFISAPNSGTLSRKANPETLSVHSSPGMTLKSKHKHTHQGCSFKFQVMLFRIYYWHNDIWIWLK